MLGEADADARWRNQTPVRAHRSPVTANLPVDLDIEGVDRSPPCLLRVPSRRFGTTRRFISEAADALIAFVPYAAAAGQCEEPGAELAAPDTGFAEHLTFVLAAASFRTPRTSRQRSEERDALSRPDQASSFWEEPPDPTALPDNDRLRNGRSAAARPCLVSSPPFPVRSRALPDPTGTTTCSRLVQANCPGPHVGPRGDGFLVRL